MTVSSLERTTPRTALCAVNRAEIFDDSTGLGLIRTTPGQDPALWSEFLRGARASYARHGVTTAIEADEHRLTSETALFFASVDMAGNVVGGVRGQGAYERAEQSHALTEWFGNPGREMIRSMIDARVDDGVVEMKTAWVGADAADPGLVAGALARVALPTMDAMNARWVMATAAEHVLRRWESSGGRVEESIPHAAYPDSRYRTRIMWWDRLSLVDDAQPVVLSRMRKDARALNRSAAFVAA